jgi:anti-sigma factor RsiW
MNPCEAWRQAITDHALGGIPSAPLATHLQSCPACAASLRAMQARLRHIDSGVQQLVAAEPSADAPEQILARIRSAAHKGASQVQPRTRPSIAWAAAAAFILLVSAGALYRQHVQQNREAATLSAAASISSWRSPTQELLASRYAALNAASPRLGQYFYSLQTVPPIPQRQNVPEKDKHTP